MFRYVLIALLALSLASPAIAVPKRIVVTGNTNPASLLTASTLDAARTTPTILIKGYDTLTMQVRLTRGGGLTALVTTCEESIDAVTWSQITVNTAGAITPITLTRTTSVSENYTLRVPVAGYVNVRCTFTGTASTIADVITVLGRKLITN